MNFFLSPQLMAIGKFEFRQFLIKYVCACVSLGISWMAILLWSENQIYWKAFSVFTLILFIPVLYLFNKNLMGRLYDYNPNIRLGYGWFFVYLFPCIFLFPLVIFLAVKDKSDKPIPALEHLWITTFACTLCFLLTLNYPFMTYWLGTPSAYFISKTYSDTQSIIKIHSLLQSKGELSALEEFKKNHHFDSLSSTERVLMVASFAQIVIKKKESGMDDSRKIEFKLSFLEGLQEFSRSKENPLHYRNINPLSFLQPNGAVEIILLTFVELDIHEKFNETLNEKSKGIASQLENEIKTLPIDQKNYYLERLNLITSRLGSNNNHRDIASTQK